MMKLIWRAREPSADVNVILLLFILLHSARYANWKKCETIKQSNDDKKKGKKFTTCAFAALSPVQSLNVFTPQNLHFNKFQIYFFHLAARCSAQTWQGIHVFQRAQPLDLLKSGENL